MESLSELTHRVSFHQVQKPVQNVNHKPMRRHNFSQVGHISVSTGIFSTSIASAFYFSVERTGERDQEHWVHSTCDHIPERSQVTWSLSRTVFIIPESLGEIPNHSTSLTFTFLLRKLHSHHSQVDVWKNCFACLYVSAHIWFLYMFIKKCVYDFFICFIY